MSEFYRHSGRVPVLGFIAMFIGTLVVAIVMGTIYSVAINLIPFVYLNFGCTAAFGLAVGYCAGAFSRVAHLRNPFITGLVVFASVCAGYYVCWGVDLLARIGPGNIRNWRAAFVPEVLSEYIAEFYHTGFWSFSFGRSGNLTTNNVSGGWLGLIWFIEFMTILVGSLGLSGVFDEEAKSVYCEGCRRWMTTKQAVLRRSALSSPAVLEAFACGDVQPLLRSPQPDPTHGAWYEVDLATCDGCRDSLYATVLTNKKSIDSDGKETFDREAIIRLLRIDETLRDVILGTGIADARPNAFPVAEESPNRPETVR